MWFRRRLRTPTRRFEKALPKIRKKNCEDARESTNSAVGDSGRDIFWDRTAAAWPGKLGIGSYCVVVGGIGPRACALSADASCDRLAVVVVLIGIPAATQVARGAGNKRSAVRRD